RLSARYSPLEGRFLRVTQPSATGPEGPVRLACFTHAASVCPEPGSNSPSECGTPQGTDFDRVIRAPLHSSLVKVAAPHEASPPGARKEHCIDSPIALSITHPRLGPVGHSRIVPLASIHRQGDTQANTLGPHPPIRGSPVPHLQPHAPALAYALAAATFYTTAGTQ